MRIRTILSGASASLAAATLLATAVTPASATPSINRVGMSPNAAVHPMSINRTNEKTAFNFFVGKGLTKKQAAGIVGNLDQESGMDPTIHQIGGGPGRGIAQWSVGGRWDTYSGDNVVGYAKSQGQSATSLNLQLKFVWYELTKFSYYGLSSLRGTTTINGATVSFQNNYEGCGTCDTSAREAYAADAYSRYA
ncbi:MAG TPA: phage tail tip lysozyme [Jatrophihabitans sp.]|nr:phage tail tip lysozyme [Jatrophihabitans sp.]